MRKFEFDVWWGGISCDSIRSGGEGLIRIISLVPLQSSLIPFLLMRRLKPERLNEASSFPPQGCSLGPEWHPVLAVCPVQHYAAQGLWSVLQAGGFRSAAPENPQRLSLGHGRSCRRNCLFLKWSQGEKPRPISPSVRNCLTLLESTTKSFFCHMRMPIPRPALPLSTSHSALSPTASFRAAWGRNSWRSWVFAGWWVTGPHLK